MKKLIIASALSLSFFISNAQSEFKIVTIIESIVPGGIGRSRIVEAKTPLNVADFTTSRTGGKGGGQQGKVKRTDAKIDAFDESKILNFYSMSGINFQNIASNDALIASKINDMIKAGWKLTFITSGVEADAGKSDSKGLFITRLYFSK